MPTNPVAASAAPMPVDRRLFLTSGAAAAVFSALHTAKAASPDAEPDVLSDLIAQHRKAREAFIVAMNGLEEASPDFHAPFVGIVGREYKLGVGQEKITKEIAAHFEQHAEVLRRIDQLSPGAASPALAALVQERDAALARLDAIFAPEVTERERYDAASEAEFDTLTAICGHRCDSPEELARKFRYLKEYSDELQSEQYDAILNSFLPEAESDEA